MNLHVRWKVDLEKSSPFSWHNSGDSGDYENGDWMDVTFENDFFMTISGILHSFIHTKT
ncbi:MAG: hypothetical protein GY931_10255 [Maribacter sp.]|nr:hypothetical protein [Maribacter sp.]